MMKKSREFVIKQLHTSDIFPGLLDTFAHSQKITKKWIKNREDWALLMCPFYENGVQKKEFGFLNT